MRKPNKLGQIYLDKNIQKNWFFENYFLSSFLTNLSTTFPRGEKFFIDAVREYRHTCPTHLQNDISSFIGQEAWHTIEHKTLNDALKLIGYDHISKLEKGTDGLLNFADKHLHPSFRLAITVGLEHLTAVFAEEFLNNPEWVENISTTELKNIWLWHATEEYDHKHVSFDVYRYAGYGYTRRVLFYTLSVIALIYMLLRYQETDGPLDTIYGLKKLFFIGGFLTNCGPKLLKFYLPNFHP